MIERGAVAGLNHLLEQHPWAADRLKPFAGQRVDFRCPPLPELRLGILADGRLREADEGKPSALVVTLKPAALPLLLSRDESALKQVQIEGSAELAGTVQHLFRTLSWDCEEDFSRLVGDVVAQRLASGGKALAAWPREAATRLAENLAEYWTEERPLLARPADVEKFRREVDALGDDAARLEQRIERLENGGKR
jgi:ubiquinone biosynthesis accessory factor UbiJ